MPSEQDFDLTTAKGRIAFEDFVAGYIAEGFLRAAGPNLAIVKTCLDHGITYQQWRQTFDADVFAQGLAPFLAQGVDLERIIHGIYDKTILAVQDQTGGKPCHFA